MKRAAYLFFFLLIIPVLWAQQKYGLVIGNGAYTGIGSLTNPVNDAEDMQRALYDLGFANVDIVKNGNLEQMETAIANLGRRLSASRNSYGFFFYAGHGVQSTDGDNYLIPVEANSITNAATLRQRAVSLQYVITTLSDAGNELNMIVLDACRDNPFGWARGGSRGLSVVNYAPSGSIIMYATAANSTADDNRSGRNGLFTGQLLNNLRTPGLSVYEVFDKTMGDVQSITNGRQHPELSLRFSGAGSIYLGSRPSPGPNPNPSPLPVPVPAGLEYQIDGRSVTITKYTGNAAALEIPALIQGLPVTVIGNDAFSWYRGLTSITIPSSVTSIGIGAFYECSSLTSITIPSSVTSIGDWAFVYCSSLTSIIIPSSVTSIGNWAFSDCNRLTSITIPSSVTSIGRGAFSDCSILASVTIPSSVTYIDDYAFSGCSRLASITIPSSVTSISRGVFRGCTSLASVTIPSSVTYIDDHAFSGCSRLASVTIPSSVTYIGSSAFMDCTSLTSITLPSSITYIDDYAFSGCSRLASVTIPSSVTSIGSVAFGSCISLVSIVIPSSVTSIGNFAFSNCKSLASISIPSSVSSIGDYAFNLCSSLTSVTLSRRTQVGQSVFPSTTRITYRD